MRTKFAASCFIMASLLAPVAAHADGDTDRTHPMTFVADSVITTKVKAKLANDKMRTLVHVKVDTDAKGAVVLGGNVRTKAEADQAVAIARGTEGVTSVTSNIQIKKDD